jgi:hypothetical protein
MIDHVGLGRCVQQYELVVGARISEPAPCERVEERGLEIASHCSLEDRHREAWLRPRGPA